MEIQQTFLGELNIALAQAPAVLTSVTAVECPAFLQIALLIVKPNSGKVKENY